MIRAHRLWLRVEPHVDTRSGALLVAGAALVAHSLVGVVLPVAEGADYVTYVRVYAEMWSWTSVIPWEMLWRMPVAPALIGLPLDLGGPWAGRVAEALAFATSVTLWFRVAMRFGPPCAVAVALVLIVAPSYQMLFHQYSSDAVSGLGFAFLALALARAWECPSYRRIAELGIAIVLMILTRPAHQVLVLLIPVPLLFGGEWWRRARLTLALAACVLLPCIAWAGLNGARYDDRALSRGGGAWTPFYRVYLTEQLVDPANGPASAELASLVRRDLLSEEPYRSRGIDVERFFREPSTRYHEDLVGLTDRVYGWGDRNAILRRVAIEGIEQDPWAFVRGVVRSFVTQLVKGDSVLPVIAAEPRLGQAAMEGDSLAPSPPIDGGPIPAARFSYWLSRPDNAFSEVWTSPTDHHIVSSDPALLERLDRLNARVSELRLPPSHEGSTAVMLWVNRANRLFPPALLWLAVAVVALAVRRPRNAGPSIVLVLAGLAVLGATLLSVPPIPRFVSPLYPAFVVIGLAGLLGRRSPPADPSG